MFHPLRREDIQKIVDLQIALLQKRLASQHLDLQLTEDAKKHLAAEGYDPAFGARPLRRVIQQRIENPLATEILKGAFEEGAEITIDYVDGDFVFQESSKPTTDAR